MKNNIILTEQEEIGVIFDRASSSIIRNLWALQEKHKMENFDPDDVVIKSLERYKLSVYYYNSEKEYCFSKKDARDYFRDLSQKIFDDILSKFKTISLYNTSKNDTRRLYRSYAFNVKSFSKAALNDYTRRDITYALETGVKKIEVVEFFSQKPLLVINAEFTPFPNEN